MIIHVLYHARVPTGFGIAMLGNVYNQYSEVAQSPWVIIFFNWFQFSPAPFQRKHLGATGIKSEESNEIKEWSHRGSNHGPPA